MQITVVVLDTTLIMIYVPVTSPFNYQEISTDKIIYSCFKNVENLFSRFLNIPKLNQAIS